MALRILLLLVVLAIFYGCGQSTSPPEQGEKEAGVQPKSETSSGPAQQETTQQKSEAANTNSVGRCADEGSTVGQQAEAGGGEVSNGKIAFSRSTFSRISESTAANTDIHLIDREGAHETQLTHTKQFEEYPVWSPDGQKIAFIRPGELYVMNADGTKQTQLAEYVREANPAWSPDGQKIAFSRGVSLSEPIGLYVINADGTNEADLIPDSFSGNSEDQTQLGSPAWSPDGNKIAFASRTQTDTGASASSAAASAPLEELSGIYLIKVDSTGLCKLTSVSEDNFLQGVGPVWSPDGNKLAFYDFGAINVINADGSGRKELTGSNAPPQHAWSPDGQRIAFIDASSELSVINADGRGLRRLTDTPGQLPVALPTWSPDSEKIAYSCPFEDTLHPRTDLCVINADGRGWKRIASKVTPVGFQVTSSWGRG